MLMRAASKTEEEIEKMRLAGRLAAEVLNMIRPYVKAGITTDELDQICHKYIVEDLDAVPAPLNYHGFPKSICTSVNHVVCHGIPGPKKLKSGDIVNIDITVIKDGFHGDTSKMFYVNKPTVLGKRVSEISYESLLRAIDIVKPGTTLGDIGYTIQTFAERQNFSVVREYCGHGIGREFHEDPQVLHYGTPNTGMVLIPGMTFTIEPMINVGGAETRLLPDNWTVVTRDHSLSAQWEHTILVTETGHEVLTVVPGDEL